MTSSFNLLKVSSVSHGNYDLALGLKQSEMFLIAQFIMEQRDPSMVDRHVKEPRLFEDEC